MHKKKKKEKKTAIRLLPSIPPLKYTFDPSESAADAWNPLLDFIVVFKFENFQLLNISKWSIYADPLYPPHTNISLFITKFAVCPYLTKFIVSDSIEHVLLLMKQYSADLKVTVTKKKKNRKKYL